MKILHLYSDWKWTGPAEPVLQMCQSLQDRGHEVLLAHCASPKAVPEDIAGKAAAYGVRTTTQWALDRHWPMRATWRDFRGLPRFVAAEGFEVVHMHLSHDHALGAGSCRLALGRRAPVLVRTLHRRSVLESRLGSRYLLRRLSDGLLLFTESFRQATIERFGLDPERVGVQPLTIDLERFSPSRRLRDVRTGFGIAPDAPLIGIVGRYQKYRKAEVFLEAAARLAAEEPQARFLVIGRSSQLQETVVAPMQRLGLGDRVVLTGYRIEDYDDILGALDVFTLLMPGSDGTARAVREALALGRPCVVSDFGMLPEIVRDGETGLVVPAEPEALAAAWLRLVRERPWREQLGRQAAAYARSHFSTALLGERLEGFYARLQAKARN